MVTLIPVEFVIFICCCELLPTFTDPRFTEVGLAVTDDAATALHAKIKSKNSITTMGNAKEIFFDMFRFARCRRGVRHDKNLPGPLDFHYGGSLRIGCEKRLLAWRHARGQGKTLSSDVLACNAK